MKIHAYDPDGFSDLQEAWEYLQCGSEMTAFQLYNWYLHINHLYSRGVVSRLACQWVYLLVQDEDGTPVMIAPLEIRNIGLHVTIPFAGSKRQIGKSRGAYFIGHEGYTDYCNLIYRNFSSQALDIIIEYVGQQYHCSRFIFERLFKSTSVFRWIYSNYEAEESENYCATLRLPASFEQYEKQLSKHARQNLRTALNRQVRDQISFTYEVIHDLNADTIEALKAIRNSRLKQKRQK